MRNIFYILIITLLFIGCTNQLIDDTHPNQLSEMISFTTLRDKISTRYANDNKSNYQVYATIKGEEDKGWFINNTLIPSSTSGGNDTISDNTTYYYPYGKSIQFYAYAPSYSASLSVTADSSTPSIAITLTVPSHTGNDFTIATPITQSSGKVSFQFKHMLTKINTAVKLSSALTDAGYSTNSNYQTILKVAYNAGTINATDSIPSWTNVTGPTGGLTYTNSNSFIFMPQEFTTTADDSSDYGNCTMQIIGLDIYLTVNGQTSTMFNGDLMEVGIPDGLITNNTFEVGKQYNIVLNISDLSKNSSGDLIFNAVDFSVDVASWEENGDTNLAVEN